MIRPSSHFWKPTLTSPNLGEGGIFRRSTYVDWVETMASYKPFPFNQSLGHQLLVSYGGFHCHGGTPIAGWFISGKVPSRNGWWLGVPPWLWNPRWSQPGTNSWWPVERAWAPGFPPYLINHWISRSKVDQPFWFHSDSLFPFGLFE